MNKQIYKYVHWVLAFSRACDGHRNRFATSAVVPERLIECLKLGTEAHEMGHKGTQPLFLHPCIMCSNALSVTSQSGLYNPRLFYYSFIKCPFLKKRNKITDEKDACGMCNDNVQSLSPQFIFIFICHRKNTFRAMCTTKPVYSCTSVCVAWNTILFLILYWLHLNYFK